MLCAVCARFEELLGSEVSSATRTRTVKDVPNKYFSLAQAELYSALAALFRPDGPELELFETDESDVTRVHDFIISLPKLESKGIRVTVG